MKTTEGWLDRLRARRERRKDFTAAYRMISYLNASTRDTGKNPEELIVEGWLWMVAGEDAAARAVLSSAVVALDGELPDHWNEWWDARELES